MEIFWAALVLGAMGLTGASKLFAVPSNPKRDAVREVLPGANCGGCGFPGCDGCADAIASGKAPVNACPVGGAEVAAKVASIMGVEADTSSVKKVATVICQGDAQHCRSKFDYTGIQDCVAASLVNDGYKSCKYACLGLGTCVKACPFDAIHIDEHRHIAVVDPDKCQSCGKCVEACPKHVLELQPETRPVRLLCRAADEGHVVSDNCRIGCIGCERCAVACKFDAITMVNHLPKIDMDKCRGCMMCAEVCPTDAMWADWDERKIAEIDQDACIGCGMCAQACPWNMPRIDSETGTSTKCISCGRCAEQCPNGAILFVDWEDIAEKVIEQGVLRTATLVQA